MTQEHPLVGGKRPRQEFRHKLVSPNFAIVNFLDEKNDKTAEQEIIPMSWIRNGKQPQCFWPSSSSLTRRQIDNMVSTCFKPNDKEFTLFPIRILHSGCTYSEAKDKFETLASKSNAEDNFNTIDSGEVDCNQDTDFEVDESESEHEQPAKKGKKSDSERGPEQSAKKRKKNNQSQKNKPTKKDHTNKQARKVDKRMDNDLSFEFSDDSDDQIDHRQGHPMQKSSKTSSNRGQDSRVSSSPTMFTFNKNSVERDNSTRLSKSSGVARSLFAGSENLTASTPDFISRGEFLIFETKVFHKLNLIQQMVADVNENTKTSARSRELISFPSGIGDKFQLPATDIKTLESLDLTLKDTTIRSELATYLSQLGGRTASDFLSRSLPKVVSDEVCCLTNWSGSAIAEGSLDTQGNLITREFKKTFSNLTNLVDMFCESSRLVSPTTSDKVVEGYIKKWLLAFKDRITPRKHIANAGKSPRKKISPKKKKN